MKEFICHCTEIREEDGWYLPVRYTDSQMTSFARREPLLLRAHCGAGFSLAFYTTGTQISLEYKITEHVRDHANVDVFIDGIQQSSVDLAQLDGKVQIEISGSGERLVELYLPHLVKLWVRNLTADGALHPVKPKEKFWLFLGDSITHGLGTKYPSLAYPVQLSRYFECDYVNMGVCGGTFWAADLDNHHREPDIITIALGTNDWKMSKSPQEFRENVSNYLTRLASLYACQNVFAILPFWRRDWKSTYNDMTFEDVYTILKEEYGKYPYIKQLEGTQLIPNHENFYVDGVHPNDAGLLHASLMLSKIPEIQRIMHEREEK